MKEKETIFDLAKKLVQPGQKSHRDQSPRKNDPTPEDSEENHPDPASPENPINQNQEHSDSKE